MHNAFENVNCFSFNILNHCHVVQECPAFSLHLFPTWWFVDRTPISLGVFYKEKCDIRYLFVHVLLWCVMRSLIQTQTWNVWLTNSTVHITYITFNSMDLLQNVFNFQSITSQKCYKGPNHSTGPESSWKHMELVHGGLKIFNDKEINTKHFSF